VAAAGRRREVPIDRAADEIAALAEDLRELQAALVGDDPEGA
jgi:hypothetical protein